MGKWYPEKSNSLLQYSLYINSQRLLYLPQEYFEKTYTARVILQKEGKKGKKLKLKKNIHQNIILKGTSCSVLLLNCY